MTTRELAEKLYRKEHPRPCQNFPYGRQPQLSDLWEADQVAYENRVESLLALLRESES